MYYILYLEALSGGPSWVFSINQLLNISHTKRFKKSKFEAINGEHYCSKCFKIMLKRFNPFKLLN